MTKILFIGSFLSQKTGTKGISEKIVTLLKPETIEIQLSSSQINKYSRIVSIIVSIFFTKAPIIHFDVFSGNAFTITKIGSTIARFRKKKIIFTLRGGGLEAYTEQNKMHVLEVLKNADIIQTPSLFLQNYFQSLNFKVNYLPNFIQLDNFKYDRLNVKKNTLLWVRAFDSIYNPTVPVLVLNELLKFNPEITLTMVGPDKGQLENVKQLIQELKIEKNITITGPIQNELLYQYYQTHHVYINTTSLESFGMSLIEAASCGIPIVSNKVGEIPLIWKENENILLIENNDTKEFVEKIKSILDNSDFENSLSTNARKFIEQFKWENIKSAWINVLK